MATIVWGQIKHKHLLYTFAQWSSIEVHPHFKCSPTTECNNWGDPKLKYLNSYERDIKTQSRVYISLYIHIAVLSWTIHAICAALCTQLQVTKRFVSQNNIRRLVYDMVDGVDQDTTMRMELNQSDDGHFGMSSWNWKWWFHLIYTIIESTSLSPRTRQISLCVLGNLLGIELDPAHQRI